MNFEKMSVNNYWTSGKNDLSDFTLSQPWGYISHFYTDNYSPVSSTYSNNGEFCNHKCNVCVYKNDVYTACPNKFNEPKVQFVETKGQPYLKIPDKIVEMLKIITDEHLLYVAQAVIDEMEARGYGSKKN